MRWVIGIVVVAVLVILGYQYFRPGSEQIAEQAEQPAEQAAETAQQATEDAAEVAGEAAQTAGEMAEEAGAATEQTMGEATEEMAQAGEELAQSAALVVGDIDLGRELTGVVDRVSGALSGITDAASAEAALPTLNEVRTKLDDLTATVEQLPAEARTTLAGVVSGMLPKLQTLVDQVSGIEGVGEVVKPAVEPIMAKLDAWAKQPA